jgi:hypothetical protein
LSLRGFDFFAVYSTSLWRIELSETEGHEIAFHDKTPKEALIKFDTNKKQVSRLRRIAGQFCSARNDKVEEVELNQISLEQPDDRRKPDSI